MSELNWSELWDETEQRYRVQTRDGRKVRIWTTDALSDVRGPVWGEIDNHGWGNGWSVESWLADGTVSPDDIGTANDDLVPEPRRVRRWVNVYEDPCGKKYPAPISFPTERQARLSITSRKQHIATVPVEWEE